MTQNDLTERMARASYEKYFEGQIGCCEDPWNELPLRHRDRLIDAQKAAINEMFIVAQEELNA